MSESDAKIKVKVGDIEVEYEGDPGFLENGLNDLIGNLAEIHKTLPAKAKVATAAAASEGGESHVPQVQSQITLGTASIAARTSAKTGPDLAICAMAHLELAKGATSYPRKDILAEMKNATGYYTNSIGSNIGKSITTLLKAKRINEVGTGQFCLSATERKELETSLADNE